MRKHMFLLRWEREGRTVVPKLDTYSTCIWPLPPEGKDRDVARGYLAMIDGEENLPDDVKRFMQASNWIHLRKRYGNDLQGPYLIDDNDEVLNTPEELEEFLGNLDDAGLAKYLMRPMHTYAQAGQRRRR